MFSRRHPFLFFTLVLSSVSAFTVIGVVALLVGSSALINANFTSVKTTSEGNVGIIELTGVITSSKQTIKHIKSFRKDNAIKAIILRIDSPGGGVGPAQEIYREILKTRQAKKIIASLGAVAASGGYYAAAATHGIMANPGTITGSIGVIMEYANIQEIMKKIGLTPVVIKSGEYKDMGSPAKKISAEEKKILQSVVDQIHLQFVRDVANGRDVEQEKINKLADGRIYTGEKAVELNLVDKLGNLEDAVQWAGKLAGITGEIKAVYPKEDKMTTLRNLIQSVLKEAYISGTITNNLRHIVN